MRRRQHLLALGALALRALQPLRQGRLAMAGLLGGAGVTVLDGCAGPLPMARLQGNTMGTIYRIQLVAEQALASALRPQIETLLGDLDARLSTYRHDSEVSRFNRSAPGVGTPIAPDTGAVVQLAAGVARASSGAFDATVGPLVDLWGFGPPGRAAAAMPGAAAVDEAAARVGYTQIEYAAAGARLVKTAPGVNLDLSGVAKGHAVDALARLLTASGVRDYTVDIGGEVLVAGTRPDGRPWRIGIEQPSFAVAGRRTVHRVVTPGALQAAPAAAATSGTYRNFFDQGGHRYSHSIDPRTARPVRHTLVSVTVLAPQAALADAWATALLVSGPRTGIQLASDLGLSAYFIEQRAGTLVDHWSEAMAVYLEQARGVQGMIAREA